MVEKGIPGNRTVEWVGHTRIIGAQGPSSGYPSVKVYEAYLPSDLFSGAWVRRGYD